MRLATVILAAGKGKRMKSDLPKVLHPLNGRPMIHYVIDVAEAVGSERIILIVGHKKELVEEICRGRNVEFAVQSQQLGTGHAVHRLRADCAGRERLCEADCRAQGRRCRYAENQRNKCGYLHFQKPDAF